MSKLSNINFSYAEQFVLQDIDLELYPGEIHGLVGVNGAGKSTCMKVLIGLLEASSGNRDIQEKQIGWLGEKDLIYPDMKVKNCLKFLYQMYCNSIDGFEDSWKSLACDLGLIEIENRLIENLSFGNKRRVAIAAAFIHRPNLIVLDEPSIGLDPEMVAKFRVFLNKNKKNRKILISSHLLSEMDKIADRVSIIHNGRMIYTDTLFELKSKSNDILWALKAKLDNNVVDRYEFKLVDGIYQIKLSLSEMNELIQSLHKKEIVVEAFYPVQHNLEQIFLSLIQDENDGALNV